jgi:hypothetical protein
LPGQGHTCSGDRCRRPLHAGRVARPKQHHIKGLQRGVGGVVTARPMYRATFTVLGMMRWLISARTAALSLLPAGSFWWLITGQPSAPQKVTRSLSSSSGAMGRTDLQLTSTHGRAGTPYRDCRPRPNRRSSLRSGWTVQTRPRRSIRPSTRGEERIADRQQQSREDLSRNLECYAVCSPAREFMMLNRARDARQRAGQR